SSPALTGAAVLDHRRGEWHGGLQPAQICGQGRAIQPAQRLQAQAAVRAADRLREVLAGVS
ncbi:MAG: hypothetical protein NT053_14305, partial [Cyanobacteria bacterium]|nr:hypothetical protein [Cyanobacteriota bacterium]